MGDHNTNDVCHDENLQTFVTASRIREHRVQDVPSVRHICGTERMHAALTKVTPHHPLLRRDEGVTLLADKRHCT